MVPARILVLSPAIPETRYAGSLLLYRLLEKHASSRLLIVGPKPHPASRLLNCEYKVLPPRAIAKLNRTRFAVLKRSIEAFGMIDKLSVRAAQNRLGSFQPDVVVTVMEQLAYADLAMRFCKSTGLPLVLIVHDLLAHFEPVYRLARSAQERHYRSIYNFAAERLCISPGLRDCLRLMYGSDGDVLYPSRSETTSPRVISETANLKRGPNLTLGYAGGLGYGYGEQIHAILPILERSGVRLRIYSRDDFRHDSSALEYAGYAPPEETWERIKTQCDATLLVYTWSPVYRDLYQTHFPSKLPEYVALGLPMLVVGPGYAAGVAWSIQHPGTALVVTDPAETALAEALQSLYDPEVRRRLVTESFAAGDAEFSPAKIRDAFYAAILRALPQ